VLLGAALAIRSFRQAVVPGKDTSSVPRESTEGSASSECLARAQSHAAAGQYRDAVRALYLATVLYLDDREKVPFDPTLTNREHLGVASKEARLLELLRPLVLAFDSAWYGRRACTPTEFEECCQLARKIGLAA